ncbi:hypothetical protein AMTRI_Chr07g30330 [Amborella trichopoda]
MMRFMPHKKAVVVTFQRPPKLSDGSDWPKDQVIKIDVEEDEVVHH